MERLPVLLALLGAACAARHSATVAELPPEESALPEEAAPSAEPDVHGAVIGEPAPGFELPDLQGREVRLADFRGKTVVLEWFNPECPFSRSQHENGRLRTLPETWTAKGVVWFLVNSGGPDRPGSGREANLEAARQLDIGTPILLDESGEVGRAYGAEKTPELFVIDTEGRLAYRGALDNAPFGKVQEDGPFRDFLGLALSDLALGRPVETPVTEPRGSTVKYARVRSPRGSR